VDVRDGVNWSEKKVSIAMGFISGTHLGFAGGYALD